MITFVEFLARRDADPDLPEDLPHWINHWRNALPPMLQGEHNGDCTEQPQTCIFCWLEDALHDYRIEVAAREALDYMLAADGNLTVGELRQQIRDKFGAEVDAELASRFGKHT